MNSTERLVVKAFFFAFEKSMVKVSFISLLAMFCFYEKHSKSYFSFLCSHKETKQRNAPAQTPPDRYAA